MKLIRNKLGDYDKFLTFDFQKIQMTSYIRDIDFNEEVQIQILIIYFYQLIK